MYGKLAVLDSIHGQVFTVTITNTVCHHKDCRLFCLSSHVLLRLQLAEQPELDPLRLRQTANTIEVAAQLAPLRNVAVRELEAALDAL